MNTEDRDISNLHPKGVFEAEVISTAIVKAKSTDTVQIAVCLRTEHGQVTDYFPMTEKAAQHTAKKIRALGFTGTSFGDLADEGLLAGNHCWATIDRESYRGELKTRIRWIDHIDSPPGLRSDADAAMAVTAFDALLADGNTSAELPAAPKLPPANTSSKSKTSKSKKSEPEESNWPSSIAPF